MTDLNRLASALQKVGVDNDLGYAGSDRVIRFELSGERTIWDGKSDDGWVAFFFRDLVRTKAPGAYVCPGGGHKPNGLTSIMNLPCYGPADQPNETSAWASAVVALDEAGMVGDQ